MNSDEKNLRILEIKCPCCQATLRVDADDGTIYSHEEAKREHQSLETFMEQQKNRSNELEAKLAEAKEKEKNKRELLEKKFQAAKQNKNLKDPPPGVLWD